MTKGAQMPSLTREISTRTISTTILLGLILLSFALRIYRLDGQSLWGDEGLAIYHSNRSSVAAVLRDTYAAGNNPPLYYLALHFWMPAVGQSEFALRYLSFIFGVLTVPAVFVLGRRLGGWPVGLIGALLQLLSPYHVYYSQELRMYAPMVFWITLSSYFFWCLFTAREKQSWRVWGGYTVTSALAIYCHIFAGPVIAAHGVVWLVDLAWRRRGAWRTALRCMSAQTAVLLLFIPWLAYIWSRVLTLSNQVEQVSVALSTILRRCLIDFSVSAPIITSTPEEIGWPILTPFLLLLVLALLWPWKRRSAMFLLVCLSMTILAIFLISFPPLPGWVRYFAAASPHYYLMLALGADGMGLLAVSRLPTARQKVGRAVLSALMIVPLNLTQIRSLHRYYTDSTYWRWDYRGQITDMAQDTQTNGAILFNGREPSFIFKYYLPTNTPYAVVPSTCNADARHIQEEIAAIAADHERIWLVRTMPLRCDRNHRVAQWLKEHAYQVSETWLENNAFDLYLMPSEMGKYRPPAQSSRLTFGGQFELLEFALNHKGVTSGDALAVALRWRTLSSMDVDYKFFLVLLGPNGETFSLKDGMPLNWLRPTTLWEAGEIEEDRWGMAVRAGTPAGVYPLYVGAYDPATGERIPLQTTDGEVVGDKLLITKLEVFPRK